MGHKITGNGFITPKKQRRRKEVNRDLGASNFRKLQNTQNSGNLNILFLYKRENFLMFLNNACARL